MLHILSFCTHADQTSNELTQTGEEYAMQQQGKLDTIHLQVKYNILPILLLTLQQVSKYLNFVTSIPLT